MSKVLSLVDCTDNNRFRVLCATTISPYNTNNNLLFENAQTHTHTQTGEKNVNRMQLGTQQVERSTGKIADITTTIRATTTTITRAKQQYDTLIR